MTNTPAMKLRGVLAAGCAAVLVGGALVNTASAAPGGVPGKPEKKEKSHGFLVGTSAVTTDPLPALRPEVFVATASRPMQGVRDPMFARAVAITGEGGRGETMVLVQTTAIGLFAAYRQGPYGIIDVRRAIAARTGIPVANVLVQSDHSHSAPDTIGLWGGVPVAYLAQLRDALVASAVEAFSAREPVTLRVASVQGPKTKSSYSAGPNARTDDEFRLLVADRSDGSRALSLVNYSPHATVVGRQDTVATSGDWPAWAAQEAELAYGGFGVGTVGSIGAMDWNKTAATTEGREAEARQRLRELLARATAALEPVRGDAVQVQTTFLREPFLPPTYGLNNAPGGVLPLLGQRDVRVDRANTPPWTTGNLLGTYAGAVRIGEVFIATAPGEAFPKINDRLRSGASGSGGVEAQDHFFFGATNDFLGYMSDGVAEYQQVATEGTTGHFTLMVSPTMGTHVLCTAQNAAAKLGFGVGPRDQMCPLLTAADGRGDPDEPLPRP